MPIDRVRSLLVVLTLLLALSTLVLSWMVGSSDEVVQRTMRHDISWTAANARVEVSDLTRAVLEGDDDAVAVRLDVLESRLETWRSGAFRAYVSGSWQRHERIEAIAAAIAEMRQLHKQPDTPSRRDHAVVICDRLAALVDRQASDAFSVSNREAHETRTLLDRTARTEQIVMGLLLLCGFALILLTSKQNAQLRRYGHAERKAAERFEHLAAHDILTGLPNRATFRDACDKALAGSYRSLVPQCTCDQTPVNRPALLLLDLDGFKPINDTFGHKFGDEVLRAAALRLKECLVGHICAMASRLGGDEFAVLLPCCSGVEDAVAHGLRIHTALRAPYMVEGIPLMVDVSVGVAVAEGAETTADRLSHCADLALNQAKARGKGQVLAYGADMDLEISYRREMEADLARAVAREEFEPFYQPVTDLTTGEIVAVEALARWRHPQRGFVPPRDFIAAAEASGHIVDIGRIILEKACRDAVAFPRPLPVAVNLSTVQLMRVDVPLLVTDILRRTGLPAHRLKLEITESVMLTDDARTRDMMDRMHALGVTVSLDDFGTGYSSLSYLSGYGFDELKIDRSFIAALQSDPRSFAIVQTIVALGLSLGLNTVAEGIETEEQAALVMACGCNRGQGYLYSAPVDLATLRNLMDTAAPAVARVA